jgi:3-deoxy-D-manno-octulosonate 8-phosphate phosphatase (KDO 8-P phosphatase)
MLTPTPAIDFAPELLLRVQGVRAVLFDLDDMLTNQTLGRRDAFGLGLLQVAGIHPLLFSGRDQPAAPQICATLGLGAVQWVSAAYGESAEKVLQRLGLPWAAVAVMGSDWADLCLMQRAGFKAAPADAHPEVLVLADWVSSSNAGHGALRELCDLLLVGSGQYAKLLRQYRND